MMRFTKGRHKAFLQWKEDNGYTQTEVAQIFGVSNPAITKWINHNVDCLRGAYAKKFNDLISLKYASLIEKTDFVAEGYAVNIKEISECICRLCEKFGTDQIRKDLGCTHQTMALFLDKKQEVEMSPEILSVLLKFPSIQEKYLTGRAILLEI